ncbi:MAG: CopG family transcriptional regulator [Candidatus Thermoplasmatota archaeon]|nr:CopG family transcriptional regulator [Candidatus Thermoplasmatota archaeon]
MEKVGIRIDKRIHDRIKERLKSTGFTSVEDYVNYVLDEVLSSMEEDEGEDMSDEDQEKVKERLRALGYLE